jgi:hypothetical protein
MKILHLFLKSKNNLTTYPYLTFDGTREDGEEIISELFKEGIRNVGFLRRSSNRLICENFEIEKANDFLRKKYNLI